MRIAPPSLPPHHSGPATRDFQSSISVEALFHRCHLDVQGLLHQQLLSSAMVQYGTVLKQDGYPANFSHNASAPPTQETADVSSPRGGSAGIRNLYSYVTSSGDIRYDNRSYAAIVQRKSRVRGQISAPSVPSCVCANELSFKICVFQVVKSPQSRRDRCYCYRRHVRTL